MNVKTESKQIQNNHLTPPTYSIALPHLHRHFGSIANIYYDRVFLNGCEGGGGRGLKKWGGAFHFNFF